MGYDQLKKAIEANEKARKSASERNDTAALEILLQENAQLEKRKKLLDRRGGFNTGAVTPPKIEPAKTNQKTEYHLNEEATTRREINENIQYYRQLLEDADEVEAATYNRAIAYWTKRRDAIDNAGKEVAELIDNPQNIDDIDSNLRILQTLKGQEKSLERIAELNKQISALEQLRSTYDNAGKEDKTDAPEYNPDANNIAGYTKNIEFLNRQLEETTDLGKASEINKEIAMWRKRIEIVRQAGETYKDAAALMKDGWGGIKSIGGGVESITTAIEGNGNAWQKLTGIVDGFIQVYDGIMAIVGLIKMFTDTNNLMTDSETVKAGAVLASAVAQGSAAAVTDSATAAELPAIAANKALTQSYMELAAAEYMAAHASIPFVGFGIASGFVAAATSLVESIGVMPFAEGGIVSGPTLGLIGEYAGASNNPEIVAPLDKLHDMLRPAGQPVVIGGTLKASGRDIVCVLANETRIAGLSGKRTNIKI